MKIYNLSPHKLMTLTHLFCSAFFRYLLFFLLICTVLSISLFSSAATTTQNVNAASLTMVASFASDTPANPQTALIDPTGAAAPKIDGKAYVLYDAQSGAFLWGENQDMPLPPASITKVMTVLLAFENLNLTDTITITRNMFESIPNDYVRLGLVEGEKITVEDALYSCLLISANDAAMALAITMGGSVDGFANMMNERAAEIGCTNTYFTNPYGYSDENHLTTAHDMALIMAEALKNESYMKISKTLNYTIPATNKFDDTRELTNGNRFVSTKEYSYENYIGGKTGFTDLSGYTIVAGARQNSRTLIGVILGASYSQVRYTNLISLFNYGFTAYSTTIIDPAEFTDIKNQTAARVAAGIEEAGYSLEITSVAMNLKEYVTTTSTKEEAGYSSNIDVSKVVIQAGLSKQVLNFPLYRQYTDGTTEEVGALAITVCTPKTMELSAPDKLKTSISSKLLLVYIVILITVIIAFVGIICVLLQKEKRRRRRRKMKRKTNLLDDKNENNCFL